MVIKSSFIHHFDDHSKMNWESKREKEKMQIIQKIQIILCSKQYNWLRGYTYKEYNWNLHSYSYSYPIRSYPFLFLYCYIWLLSTNFIWLIIFQYIYLAFVTRFRFLSSSTTTTTNNKQHNRKKVITNKSLDSLINYLKNDFFRLKKKLKSVFI